MMTRFSLIRYFGILVYDLLGAATGIARYRNIVGGQENLRFADFFLQNSRQKLYCIQRKHKNMATLTSHGQTSAAAPVKAGVTKRLRAELMKLMMAGDKNATAFPCGDNLL